MMGEEAGTGVRDSWVPWIQQVRLNTPCFTLNHAFSLSEPYPIVVQPGEAWLCTDAPQSPARLHLTCLSRHRKEDLDVVVSSPLSSLVG